MYPIPPKNKLTYFQRDQLAFFVTHPNQVQPNPDFVASLINRANQALSNLGYQAHLESRSAFSFPKVAKGDDDDSDLDDKRRPNVKPRPESSLISATVTGASDNPTEFLQMATRLEQALREAQLPGLEAVSLDWLASSSPDGNGTGGPGGWPLPYRSSPERAPFRFDSLPKKVTEGNRGEGVDVLILDTAISLQEKELAYQEWQGRHPLIHSLFRPGGRFHIERLPQPLQLHIADLRALGHEYKMSDHGLFAAGIVHSIAPCAQIYLVEVLNPYGVGDVESIVWGLDWVIKHIQENPGRKVVVNFSVCLDLPVGEQHCHTLPAVDNCFPDIFTEADHRLEELICSQIEADPTWLDNQKQSLQAPCDGILGLKSRVIAAAGNDHRPGQNVVPQARFPAAFSSVQGVGALPKDLSRKNGKLKKASYSNQADEPSRIGITTLGGEEGEGRGVLGLYLGEFPCGEPNCTKWAWWSGTSFATPIVSGVTAAVLSNLSVRRTQAALDKLYTDRDIIEDDVEQNEDALSMVQS